jgi:hypothetical protein
MALPSAPTSPNKIALLSAISASGVTDKAAPLLFGEPLLALQINHLRKLGINRFWVEVDTLPGAIVATADRLRGQGVTIDFVRSPQELSGKLNEGEILLVQSEGILADDALLTEIAQQQSPMVATVDGRDENERFERIDLNTRWTGLALFDKRTIDGIAALPDGWSIASSLLRQALQDNIPHKPVKQSVIQSGQLQRISDSNDVDAYTKTLLKTRASRGFGFIEKYIFGPIAAKIAPVIWPLKSRDMIVDGSTLFAGLASFGSAWAGFGAASASLGIVTTLLLTIRYCLQYTDKEDMKSKAMDGLIWTTLAAAFFTILWKSASDPLPNLFPAAVVIALLILSRSQNLTGARLAIVPSPAMVAALMLVFVILGYPVAGAMLIALFQLLLFVFNQIKPNR